MAPVSWKALLETGPPHGGTRELSVRVFARGGEPLLIMPEPVRVSPELAFSLYQPQTALARLAKRVWQLSLQPGWAPGSWRDTVQVAVESSFSRWLSGFTSCPGEEQTGKLPFFAILAGNPRAPARRFLIQVFDPQGAPRAVIKAGLGDAAARLSDHEATFLRGLANRGKDCALGLPAVLDHFTGPPVQAFAMEYVEGRSPLPADAQGVAPILYSWLDTTRKMALGSLLAWQRLVEVAGGNPAMQRVQAKLERLELHPALFHGDFAPWNVVIAESCGRWTVLDWERGEEVGPPGWDWFHYTLQPAILVKKETGSALYKTAEHLLDSVGFRGYLQRAGLSGHERAWLLAYLLYSRDVMRQTEGSAALSSLIDLL